MASSPGDYYRRLRLPKNASRQEIRSAFRRLTRQYHPELHPSQPGILVKYQGIREAYEVLIDRVQRQRYDRQQDFSYRLDQQLEAVDDTRRPLLPQTPSDFYLRGVRYVRSHRYQAALNDYSRAIALDSQFAEAFLRRSQVRYWLKDDPGVLSDCQRAIALNSTEAKTYYYQGMARYRLGYVQSAIAAFTDAITCDPGEPCYHYRRGLAHQDLNDLDEAAKDLRCAARLFQEQGNISNSQKLRHYLRSFGTAGRSPAVKFIGRRLTQLRTLPSQVTSFDLRLGLRTFKASLLKPFARYSRPSKQQTRLGQTGHWAHKKPLKKVASNSSDHRTLSRQIPLVPPLSSLDSLEHTDHTPVPDIFSSESWPPERLQHSDQETIQPHSSDPQNTEPHRLDSQTPDPEISGPQSPGPHSSDTEIPDFPISDSHIPAPRNSDFLANFNKPDFNKPKQHAWSRPNTQPQVKWAPGFSSRPHPADGQAIGQPVNILLGMKRILRLLSNPAGELIPLYSQLSHRQITLIGYGLAVLANLIFVFGAMQHVLGDSWLVASWFWAAGGVMFVAMMAAVAIVRLRLRVRSLWVADVFILGTAMIPLGLLTVASILTQLLAYQLAQLIHEAPQVQSAGTTLHLVLFLLAALWAFSQSLLTIYNGLTRIHRFPIPLASWFSPVVLGLGLAAGTVTWLIVSAGMI